MLDGEKLAISQKQYGKRRIYNSEKGKINLVFNVNSSNTNRPVNPTVNNKKSLIRSNSSEERAENDAFPSVTTHRLQNAKNVTISALNIQYTISALGC